MFSIDASQVREFAKVIDAKNERTVKQARSVIKKGAVNIKKDWQTAASTSRHFGQIAPTINFDMRGGGDLGSTSIEAEVGPDKRRRSARLGNIYHFGTSRGGGTGGDPIRFLEAEVPNVERWLGQIAGEL